MSIKTQTAEPLEVQDQDQNQGPSSSTSGVYAMPSHNMANDNDKTPISGPVSINADRVTPEEVDAFSRRKTLLAIEPAPASKNVVAQRAATATKAAKLLDSSKDTRLESDNLGEAFSALDDHADHQKQLQREVDHHFLDQKRQQAHFELTRKSRGFFTKIADFAGNVWSGTTPEERAKGVQGVGGIKGFFSGSNGLQNQLLKHAGIDPREVTSAPAVKAKPAPAAHPDTEFPLPMKRIFERKPAQVAPVSRVRDPEYPLPMNKLFERKEKFVPAPRDAEYPLPMNASIVDDIKDAASKIMAGIGGFFKKLIPSKSTARKLVAAGALTAGVLITGSSSCGKSCTGTHPGEPHPVASASASSDGGEGGSAPSAVASTSSSAPEAPSAVASNDPAPVPTVDKSIDLNDAKKETKKTPAPKLAKTTHLPKSPTVLNPPKVAEQKKTESPKAVELTECKSDQVLTEANLGGCLVPGADADKLRTDFYTQADAQQKALDGVFAPIANGPEYVSTSVYQRTRSPIVFLEGQGVPSDPESPNLIWQTNAANKKIVADAIVAARAKIAAAKTPKDFYDITEYLAKIGIRIDELIAVRGKQIAAHIDGANAINTEVAKGKMKEIERDTGKKVNAVPLATHKAGPTTTKSSIDLPVAKKLLEGNEADMLAAPKGEDPDKVIASVQKKLEYYRGLLELNRSLDDVRVKQRPASSRVADAVGFGAAFKNPYKPGPRITASVR